MPRGMYKRKAVQKQERKSSDKVLLVTQASNAHAHIGQCPGCNAKVMVVCKD